MKKTIQFVGGLVHCLIGSQARASARPSTFSSARALDAAIAVATFVNREANDDGARVIVFCAALGGSYIYSGAETRRRIALKFPGLALEEVDAAAQFLADRLRAHCEPQQTEFRRKSSWVHGWQAER